MAENKRAFTVIELIMSIVIIGILVAIMIPKLTATRDDAKIAVSLSEVGRLVSELTVYYTSYGYFHSDLFEMITVKDANYTTGWDSIQERGIITYYTPTNKGDSVEPCLTISIQNKDGNMTISNVLGSHENVCKGLHTVGKYQNLLKTRLLIGNNIF